MDSLTSEDPEQTHFFDPIETEDESLFNKLYFSWAPVYGMDKAFAALAEEHPDIKLNKMPFRESMEKVFRSVAKYNAAAVRYKNIAYPNAESAIEQLRVEFEQSEAKQDALKFPVINALLEELYIDTITDVVYSGYLTMSNAVENTIRQIKIVLDIPEEKDNRNDPVFKRLGIDFQQLMNKERARKHWNEVTSPRIFAINATANRIKHEFAIIRQDDVLMHYFPNLAGGEHIKISKERFFFDLSFVNSYLFQVSHIALEIMSNDHLMSIAQEHGTENTITPTGEQIIDEYYTLMIEFEDRSMRDEHKLPKPSTIPIV